MRITTLALLFIAVAVLEGQPLHVAVARAQLYLARHQVHPEHALRVSPLLPFMHTHFGARILMKTGLWLKSVWY